MDDNDYEPMPDERIHRVLSAIVWLGIVVGLGCTANFTYALKVGSSLLLLMVCIWFTEPVTAWLFQSSPTVTNPLHVRRVAWMFMLIFAGIRIWAAV